MSLSAICQKEWPITKRSEPAWFKSAELPNELANFVHREKDIHSFARSKQANSLKLRMSPKVASDKLFLRGYGCLEPSGMIAPLRDLALESC
jgi:hypothetical protein